MEVQDTPFAHVIIKIANIIVFSIFLIITALFYEQNHSTYIQYPTKIIPDALALKIFYFNILFLFIYALYSAIHLSPSHQRNDQLIYQKFGYYYALNLFFMILFQIFFIQNTVVWQLMAFFMMIGSLVTWLIVYTRTHSAYHQQDYSMNAVELLLVRVGTASWMAWILFFLEISGSIFFYSAGVTDANGCWWSELGWSSLGIYALAVFVVWCSIKYEDLVINLMFIWMILGIIRSNSNSISYILFNWTLITVVLGVVIFITFLQMLRAVKNYQISTVPILEGEKALQK